MNKVLYLIIFTLWAFLLSLMYVKGEENIEEQLKISVAENEKKVRQLLQIAIAYNASIASQMESNIDWIKSNEHRHPLTSELKDFP